MTGATVECYGVVGKQTFFKDCFAILFKQDTFSKGVVVKQTDKGFELDIYIIICYGVKVIEVVTEVQESKI